MYHEGTMRSQHAERLGHFLNQVNGINTNYLRRSPCRIGEWSKQVKDCAQPCFFPSGRYVFGCAMNGRGKQKRDANFLNALANSFGRKLNVYAECFHNVGCAAFRHQGLAFNFGCRATVAMLGNTNAASGNDECGCGRDIKCARGVPTGSAGVHQRLAAGAASVEHGIALNPNRSGSIADRFGKANNLFDRLALHVKAHQEGCNLRVRTLTGQHFSHNRAGFGARKALAMIHNAMQSFQDHGASSSSTRTALQTQAAVSVSNSSEHRGACRNHLSTTISGYMSRYWTCG